MSATTTATATTDRGPPPLEHELSDPQRYALRQLARHGGLVRTGRGAWYPPGPVRQLPERGRAWVNPRQAWPTEPVSTETLQVLERDGLLEIVPGAFVTGATCKLTPKGRSIGQHLREAPDGR